MGVVVVVVVVVVCKYTVDGTKRGWYIVATKEGTETDSNSAMHMIQNDRMSLPKILLDPINT